MTGSAVTVDASASNRAPMTRSGFERMQADLDMLRTVQRSNVLARLRRATLCFDPPLGEGVANSVRYELRLLDEQIARLEGILTGVDVVDPPTDLSRVQVGAQVTVRAEDGTEETLTVVGPAEADPGRGLVSSGSPIGQTLLGKRVGEKAQAGGGEAAVRLTVLRINTAKTEIAPLGID